METSSTLTVNGSLTILNGATIPVLINSDAPLQVSGTVAIAGTLTVVLSTSLSNSTTNVAVFNAGNITGNFSTIKVKHFEKCGRVSATEVREGGTFGVLLSVQRSACGLSTAEIAGIAIGSTIGFVIVFIIAALIGRALHCRFAEACFRSRVFKNSIFEVDY